MKRIYMIDCPGIVPPNQQDTDEELLLRGSIRAEKVEWPAQYVEAVLRRVEPKHLQRTYEVSGYTDSTSFLEMLCRKHGRLQKGGEADLDSAARIVLNDWIRGKIPWFTPPPHNDGEAVAPAKGIDGREGKLGEMPLKRKRGTESNAGTSNAGDAASKVESDDEEDEEFSGFSDNEEESDVNEDDAGVELEGDADADADAATLVADNSEDDKEVDEEVAAISAALSKARKRQKKQ